MKASGPCRIVVERAVVERGGGEAVDGVVAGRGAEHEDRHDGDPRDERDPARREQGALRGSAEPPRCGRGCSAVRQPRHGAEGNGGRRELVPSGEPAPTTSDAVPAHQSRQVPVRDVSGAIVRAPGNPHDIRADPSTHGAVGGSAERVTSRRLAPCGNVQSLERQPVSARRVRSGRTATRWRRRRRRTRSADRTRAASRTRAPRVRRRAGPCRRPPTRPRSARRSRSC